MNATALPLAVIGHLVGDYLLQNDWMALHKKQSDFRCAVHCALWTLAVCVFAGWTAPVIWALLFAAHYGQDRTNVVAWWMDTMGQRQFRTGPCAPWSSIVVDNVWHLVAITLVWRLLA